MLPHHATCPDARRAIAGIRRPLWQVLYGFALAIMMTGVARAERWTIEPTGNITAGANYTWGSGDQSTGPSLSASTGLRFSGEGARLKLDGNVSVTGIWFPSSSENDSFAPQANVNAHLEAIERFAFIDAQAYVTQTFLSPFGPQPGSLSTVTNNRYTSQSYGVSPYIQGVAPGNISYLLRFDNYWSIASSYGDSSNSVPSTYSNTLTARLGGRRSALGWTAEYIRSFYDSGLEGSDYTTEIARLILLYEIDPQLSLGPRIGYERDRFPLSTTSDVVYGIGGSWRPTPRTNVDGYWEHRFFGSSYSLTASHRLPNVAFSANFVRGLTTTPQLFLAIPAGTTVATFLDAAFTTRIPDPAERALAVQQFLAQSGLPPTLAAPLNYYAATLQLQQSQSATVVFVGVRNSLSFTVFNSRYEAITGTGVEIPPALQFAQDSTQTGIGVNYNYRLTGYTNWSSSATLSRTVSNTADSAGVSPRSNNFNASTSLNTTLGPRTTASIGASYFLFEPTNSSQFTQSRSWTANLFANLTYTF